MASRYIKRFYPAVKSVRIVGMDPLKQELELAGLKVSGGQEACPFGGELINIEKFNNYAMDADVDLVLVGLDQNFNYTKLCLASLYIQTGKAAFVCTNEDHFISIGNMQYPAAGSIVEGIQITLNNEQGSQLTDRPAVVGMPHPFAMDVLKEDHGIGEAEDICLLV